MSKVRLSSSWYTKLQAEFDKPYFEQLTSFVKQAYAAETVYPRAGEIFRAFDLCGFESTRAVLIGQDPYHGAGQADGLCFSVRPGVRLPPSLRNIFKEIQSEFGGEIPQNGNLERWAKQGVLLLNATLTVRAGHPGSHQKKGWEQFTDAAVRVIAEQKSHVVFLLWGAYAQQKAIHVDPSRHCVLRSAHPSPYAAERGFFGNGHFAKANEYLQGQNLKPIHW